MPYFCWWRGAVCWLIKNHGLMLPMPLDNVMNKTAVICNSRRFWKFFPCMPTKLILNYNKFCTNEPYLNVPWENEKFFDTLLVGLSTLNSTQYTFHHSLSVRVFHRWAPTFWSHISYIYTHSPLDSGNNSLHQHNIHKCVRYHVLQDMGFLKYIKTAHL